MTKQIKLLLVNTNNPDIQRLISQLSENYQTVKVEKIDEVFEKANQIYPCIVILDGLIPKNFKLSKALRNIFQKRILIIFFSETDSENDDIANIKCTGIAKANRCFSKGVNPQIFISYLDSMLTPQGKPPKQTLTSSKRKISAPKLDKLHKLILDPENFVAQIGDKKHKLQKKEFQILQLLAQTPNQPFFRDDILKQIWGDKEIVTPRVIDVHIRKIREKIGISYILSVPGIGYQLSA